MAEFIPIYLPQSGPNDVTATLVEWAKVAGHWVNASETVAVAETTKSVFDIEAPQAGYLYPLAQSGNDAAVGSVIAVLSPTPTSPEDAQAWFAARQTGHEPRPAEATAAKPATKKAELLAQRHGVDLTQIPAIGSRITEADVLAYVEKGTGGKQRAATQPAGDMGLGGTAKTAVLPPSPQHFAASLERRDLVDDRYPTNRTQRLLIIGGGNGAVQIIDALSRIPNQTAVAIMDDNAAIHGQTVAGVPVIGAIDPVRAGGMLASGDIHAAVISVSTSIPFRARIFAEWKVAGIPFANVIHPSAVIGMNVAMGEGNIALAFCHFGACATVGDNNFLSAYCSIEHHCVLGSHCSFGPGIVTSSRVHIGDRVRFGTGIFIEPGVKIGSESVIASGLAIWQNIPERSLLKARLAYTRRTR